MQLSISGDGSNIKHFRRRHRVAAGTLESKVMANFRTHSIESGYAGVTGGTLITFQDLSEVINFLAKLFNKGYEYYSLNVMFPPTCYVRGVAC